MLRQEIPQIDKPATPTSFLLKIKAQPNASKDEILGKLGDALKIRVKAAPEDGKANLAIETLLAHTLGLKRSQVVVKSGLSNPNKVIEIQGLNAQEIQQKLKL